MIRNRIAQLLLCTALVGTACGGTAEGDAATEEAAADVQTAATEAGPLDACFLAGATIAEAQGRASPKTAIDVGDKGVLCYGAPSARGREIMGGLVPFGAPWRMGADEATGLFLTGSATIAGTTMDPGAYSLIAIPGPDSWEIVVNSNAERWGIPINAEVRATDMFSFTVNAETTNDMVEQLSYSYGGGTITMEWENTRINIPVS